MSHGQTVRVERSGIVVLSYYFVSVLSAIIHAVHVCCRSTMLLICFEVFIFVAVVEEKSCTCMDGDVIELRLCKRKK